MFDTDLQEILLIRAPVIIFALTVHEFFHAWTANRFGDPTARNLGRMTLNPLAHLDFTGTLIMVFTSFRFGWAKPVPVDISNLQNPRKADFWISAAGPLSNIGQALIAGAIFRMVSSVGMDLPAPVWELLRFAVVVNLALALFNMLPLFPLDGSHVMRSLLPPEIGMRLARFDRFAPIVLIVLLISGVLSIIIFPPVVIVSRLILGG